MTHTPGPWRIDADRRTIFGRPVTAGDESTAVQYICTLPLYEPAALLAESEANAELIVRAVNSYAELLEMLKRMASLAEAATALDEHDATWESDTALIQAARRLIAKAEGRAQ